MVPSYTPPIPLSGPSPGAGARPDRALVTIAVVCGVLAAGLGLSGLLGLVTGNEFLRSFVPGYQTMAFSTAIACIFFGLVLAISVTYPLRGWARRILLGVFALIALAAAIEFPLGFLGQHFLVESWMVRTADAIFGRPTSPMSPATSGIMILIAIAFFLMVSGRDRPAHKRRNPDAVGVAGSAIAILGFTFALSYLEGSPFMYGSAYIPIAAPTAVALMIVGIGLVAAAGTSVFPVRCFVGSSTYARLLRYFLPVVFFVLILQELLEITIYNLPGVPNALAVSTGLVLYTLATFYVVSRVSGGLGSAIDIAEEKRQAAEDELRANHEELHAAYEQLTASEEEIRQNYDELTASQAELSASEEHYRLLFENANDAIFLYEVFPDGSPGRYLKVNSVACRQLGYSEDELLRMSVTDIVASGSRDHIRLAAMSILRDGNARYESINRRKDGTEFPVEINAHRFELNGRSVVLSVVRDITERKKADRELTFRNAIMAAQNEVAIDGILVVDEHQGIILYNPRFLEMWEIPAELAAAGSDEPLLEMVIGKVRDPAEFLTTVRYYYDRHELKGRDEVFLSDGRVFDRYTAPITGPDSRYYGRIWYFRDISEQKETENTLRENEFRLAKSMELARLVSWEYDASSGMYTFNDRFYALYGTTAEREGGYLMAADAYAREFVHPQDAGRVAEQVEKIRSVPDLFHSGRIEHRIIRRDGEVRNIAVHCTVITDAEGRVKSLGVNQDITEQKKAELELRESEARLEQAMDLAKLANWEMDVATGTFIFDDRFYALLGTTAEREGGHLMRAEDYTRKFVHPEDATIVADEIRRATSSGNPRFSGQVEHRIIRRDGELRFIAVQYTVVPDSSGKIVKTRGVIQDITERKQMEDAVREAGAYNRSLIEASPDPLVTIGPDGRITDVNEATETATGYSRTVLIGTDFSDYFKDPEKARTGYRQAFSEGTVRDYPLELLHLDGTVTPVLYNASVYRDGTGTIVGVFAAARDITRQKQAEDNLRRQHEEINAAYEQLTAAEEGLRESYGELEKSQATLRVSEEKYRNLFENMREGFAYCRMIYDDAGNPADFVYLNVNQAFTRIVGTGVVIGKQVTEVFPGIREAMPQIFEIYGRVAKTGISESFDLDFSFSAKWLHISVYSPEQGYFVAVFEDITRHKYDEDVLNLSNEVLQLSYRHATLAPLLDEYVGVIKRYTGCDSVGIRLLDKNGNIPYIAYAGFTKDFYEKESPLSIEHDHCMCINVIRGTTDPSLPFYTEAGSFFMNGTTKFLATVSEEEKGKTRNVCNQAGYESVALIPIRERDRIAGLIHLADHRDNRVPAWIVEVLEKVATPIGEAIKRILVEEELQASEEKFRSLVENVIDVFYRTDREGNLIYASPSSLLLLGFAGFDEILHRPMESFWKDPSLRSAMTAAMKKDGFVKDYEVIILRKDRSEIPVSVSSTFYRDTDGTIAGVEGVIRDISERKRYELALRESEEKFRQIFDNANDAIHLVEVTPEGHPGKILDANEVMCLRLGYTREELLGKNILDINIPDEKLRSPGHMAELFTRGSITFESGHIRKDGSVIPIELTAHLTRMQGRNVIVSVARDITQRKQEERALRLTNQKLQLMNIVAWHDIYNKITGLRGYVELSKDLIDNPQAKEFLAREEEVLKTIHEHIQYTKEYQEIGKQPLQWVNLPETLERAVRFADKSGLTISVVTDSIELYCDPVIELVFSHLIADSRAHGGHVTEIRITAAESPAGLTLAYEDNGIGIPADRKEAVFVRDVAQGTGFSLFFVRDILDLSGMEIRETGEPGKGVRFEILVPKGIFRFPDDREHAGTGA